MRFRCEYASSLYASSSRRLLTVAKPKGRPPKRRRAALNPEPEAMPRDALHAHLIKIVKRKKRSCIAMKRTHQGSVSGLYPENQISAVRILEPRARAAAVVAAQATPHVEAQTSHTLLVTGARITFCSPEVQQQIVALVDDAYRKVQDDAKR